ncbi:hypothetical protein [Halorussus caseinilyticus]|uniref:DUF397 domain-containing protein n=1 Tax=Halorussus caseinilyticus TaxID=3034025 RepID=A0ABD5WL87_9EURY
MFDRNKGEGAAVEVTGGAATVNVDVPWYSDDWAAFIAAPDANTEAVDYSGNVEE